MKFVGIVAIDEGDNNLNSYHTRSMTFGEAAEWYSKATEYVRNMVAVTPSVIEARVLIYNAAEIHSLHVQPIDGVMFIEKRELKVTPMNG